MQLRKVCNHPYLFDYPLEDDGHTYKVDDQVVLSSGKFLILDRYFFKKNALIYFYFNFYFNFFFFFFKKKKKTKVIARVNKTWS